MIGVVLAAGAGRRLRPLTDAVPKAMLHVSDGQSILDIIVSNLAAVGVTDIALVIGYRADVIADLRGDIEERHGVAIELIVNDRAEEWNNAYSLWCARDLFAQGVLLANGDTVHPVSVPQQLLAHRTDRLLLAVDTVKPLAAEEMKIRLAADGALQAINKTMDPDSAGGEYIGVAWVPPEAANDLSDALRVTFERDPHRYYEDAFQEMADRGVRIEATSIGDIPWVEVDSHEDLARAREIACHY